MSRTKCRGQNVTGTKCRVTKCRRDKLSQEKNVAGQNVAGQNIAETIRPTADPAYCDIELICD